MRCHTWPPAASDPHMGVRATMSDPPSPAPGWHILIHERAWALSGQNYPYQNATINTFINPTSESALFSPLSLAKEQSVSKKKKINNTSWLVCLRSPVPSRSLKDREPPKICTQSQLQTGRTRKRLFSLITSYKWHACLSVVRLQPSAPNGSLSDELGVPQVLVSPSADLLTHSSLNVNRSSRLITNRERQRFLIDTEVRRRHLLRVCFRGLIQLVGKGCSLTCPLRYI